MLYGNPIYKKLKQFENRNIDFTGAAVSLSGTLKFKGAGLVGPLREMTKKRCGDVTVATEKSEKLSKKLIVILLDSIKKPHFQMTNCHTKFQKN